MWMWNWFFHHWTFNCIYSNTINSLCFLVVALACELYWRHSGHTCGGWWWRQIDRQAHDAEQRKHITIMESSTIWSNNIGNRCCVWAQAEDDIYSCFFFLFSIIYTIFLSIILIFVCSVFLSVVQLGVYTVRFGLAIVCFGRRIRTEHTLFFLLYQFVFTFYLNAQRMSVEHENMLGMLTRA